MIDLTQRPNLVPKTTFEAENEEEQSSLEVEQVAERQGSARLFTAFKKNFSNNQPSRQLDLKHQYQTAAASGRQS
jgi:hypothetical protein